MNEKKQEQLKKVMQEHPEINDKIKELHAKIQEEMQAKMIDTKHQLNYRQNRRSMV